MNCTTINQHPGQLLVTKTIGCFELNCASTASDLLLLVLGYCCLSLWLDDYVWLSLLVVFHFMFLCVYCRLCVHGFCGASMKTPVMRRLEKRVFSYFAVDPNFCLFKVWSWWFLGTQYRFSHISKCSNRRCLLSVPRHGTGLKPVSTLLPNNRDNVKPKLSYSFSCLQAANRRLPLS